MKFYSYLEASGGLSELGLTDVVGEQLMTQFSTLMSRGHGVSELLAQYKGEFGHLPVTCLQRLARYHRAWKAWQKRLGAVQKSREAAKQAPLPLSFLEKVTSTGQLDAAVRTAQACPRSDVTDAAAWITVLEAGVALWDRCSALALKKGQIVCQPQTTSTEALAAYDAYVNTKQSAADITGHRWLAMRRGERDGVLSVRLNAPQDALQEQVKLTQPQLGAALAERNAASLLEELVLNDLQSALFRQIDDRAAREAIDAACRSLVGLLTQPKLVAEKVGAVHLSRGTAPPVAVIVGTDGALLELLETASGGQATQEVVDFFTEHNVCDVVVPSGAGATGALRAVEEALLAQNIPLVKVRTAALAEARKALRETQRDLTVPIASAVALAHRAQNPLEAWGTVDPVGIGIAEYQHDLDETHLRAALQESVALCRLEQGATPSKSKKTPSGSTTATVSRAKLNPLVHSIADLRAGMAVTGIVSNISRFGVFLNIGLAQEGMIHVSELSDSFVENPNDVVKIGDQLAARVLEVDARRGRIGLSCKTPRSERIGPRSGNDDRPQRSSQGSRGAALANLERLFKK